MRVAVLNQYARPAGAAGITRHADIGAELVRRGHDVTIIASTYDYLRRSGSADRGGLEIGPDGVRFAWLNTGDYSGNGRARIVSMVRYGQAAARAAMRLEPRPDVIVGSSAHLLAGLAALVASRRLHIPWVLEVRDFWPSALVDLGAIRRNGPAHRSLERLERYLYVKAPRIVSIPPRGRLRLEELGIDPAKLVHIPNASTVTANSTDVPASLGSMLHELEDRFIIAYTGSLGEAQDLATALDALASIKARNSAAWGRLAFLMVGDGVRRQELEARSAALGLDHVRFHSPIPKQAIPAVLARADAALLQLGAADFLKYGLSPNKLFDYFAAGRPVLIASAHPTVVDETDTGIRFEPGDPSAFAAAVLRMMELPEEERRRMGERGRELIRTRFSIAAITDTYESLLEGVIAERRQ
ncbi:MAG: glycosyltransferase family 4 protein [Chloroflexi bacterium]|nr:glycosyltransferase family 4 protein [Chloroflexota bacterium]